MTKQNAQFLKDCLEYSGEEGELYEDYSGRNMYGKTTCGVVFDHETLLMTAVLSFLKENPELAKEIPEFDKIQADNIGRSIIWY